MRPPSGILTPGETVVASGMLSSPASKHHFGLCLCDLNVMNSVCLPHLILKTCLFLSFEKDLIYAEIVANVISCKIC